MQTYRSHQSHLTPVEEAAAEQEIIKQLTESVEEAFASVAQMTRLPLQEVVHILEEVDVAQLTRATQEAIKKISNATDLHRADIVEIIMADKAASLGDIAYRLHAQSKGNRHRL
jgi:restriction endonuclease